VTQCYERLHSLTPLSSFLSSPQHDSNPILDQGAPFTVSSLKGALLLSDSLFGRELSLRPLRRPAFSHGFGPSNADSFRTYAEAHFVFRDACDVEGMISFPVCGGESPPLIGNDILSKCIVDNIRNTISVPSGVLRSSSPLLLPIYTAADQRTRLALNVCSNQSSKAYLASISQDPLDLAKRIHVNTHLSGTDIERLVSAGIAPKTLTQSEIEGIRELSAACRVCQGTGDPISHPKVSLRQPLRGWNEKVVADLFSLPEFTERTPILHVRDSATGYSETSLLPGREKHMLFSSIQSTWIHRHGSPKSFSADPEFSELGPGLELMGIKFVRTPARRHQTIGIAETRHRVLRRLVSRLSTASFGRPLSLAERLSHATFLSNIMLGGKILSSFEQARGYFPSLLGLPCRGVSQDMLEIHQDSIMRKAVHLFLRSASRNTLTHAALPPGTAVFFLVKPSAGRGRWEKGVVHSCPIGEPLALVQAKFGRGPPRSIALQDLRLVPQTALAEELENLALAASTEPEDGNPLHLRPVAELSTTLSRTEALLAHAARCLPYLSNGQRIGPHHKVQADIGACVDSSLPVGAGTLPTGDQVRLSRLYAATQGRRLTREEVASIAPFVVDAAIAAERENYVGAVAPLHWRDLPPGANVITAHDFFTVKADDPTPGAFRLKNRAVIHGNKDRDKFAVPSDAETAALLCVRLLLLTATLQEWRLRHVDIKGAFMQSHDFIRDVYVIPPRAWGERGIWKLLKPVYGLVDACKAWHHTLDEFLLAYGLCRIHEVFPQLFVLRDASGTLVLIVAVVVDDLLLSGRPAEMDRFLHGVCSRFTVGKISSPGASLNFAGGHVHQHWTADGRLRETTFSMKQKLQAIEPVPLSRARRKQFAAPTMPDETRLFRRLAGQISYVGLATVPPASFVSSWMQQQLTDLRVSHVVESTRLLKDLQSLPGHIRYMPYASGTFDCANLRLLCFVDASHNVNAAYGQTGFVVFIASTNVAMPVLPLHWASHRQRRVSASSYGAEILAAEFGCELSLSLLPGLALLFRAPLPCTLATDSRGLWTALHAIERPLSFRMRASTTNIREFLERRRIAGLLWIPGRTNLADSLTKRSRFGVLQCVLTSNCLPTDLVADLRRAQTPLL
jgi:Reverse transcriptase (RNA-dependent DNA polymerase)